MTQEIGANLPNDQKRAPLVDLKREHLIDSGMHSGNLATRTIAVSRFGVGLMRAAV
jgi:hypothetical protein